MSVKFKAIFLILFIFLIEYFVYIIFAPLISQEISASLFFYSIGKLAGLISFLFLSILIISGDSARFFDRYFGINNIILFQRKFALITALFVIAHPIFFMLANKSFSLIIPSFSSIPLAMGVIGFYLFIIIMTSSLLYKKISHKNWQYLHILSYVMFFFALYHAIKIGSDTGLASIKILNSVIFLLFLAGIVYRTGYKIKQRLRDKFFVKGIKKEAKGVFTLILTSKSKLLFKPGQFCFLRLNRKGLHARYPFTISSSSDERDLKFTIKLKGRFSREAQNLKKGEEVIVEGPFGIFTMEDNVEENQKDIIFIAGGVGITPFFSMIKQNLISRDKKNIFLFYCSRKFNEIIFKKELDSIKTDWLKKVYIIGDENSQDKCERGFICRELIAKYLNKNSLNNAVFFICGPEAMIKHAKGVLSNLGVKSERIVSENFW